MRCWASHAHQRRLLRERACALTARRTLTLVVVPAYHAWRASAAASVTAHEALVRRYAERRGRAAVARAWRRWRHWTRWSKDVSAKAAEVAARHHSRTVSDAWAVWRARQLHKSAGRPCANPRTRLILHAARVRAVVAECRNASSAIGGLSCLPSLLGCRAQTRPRSAAPRSRPVPCAPPALVILLPLGRHSACRELACRGLLRRDRRPSRRIFLRRRTDVCTPRRPPLCARLARCHRARGRRDGHPRRYGSWTGDRPTARQDSRPIASNRRGHRGARSPRG